MEEGKRLENMSWRLWSRETFCCESQPRFPDTPTSQAATPRPQSRKEVPDLSASVESLASTVDEYDHISRHEEHSPAVHIKGLSSGKSSIESLASSRGRGKPISSKTLEKMVIEIKNTKINQKNDMTGLPPSVTEALSMPSIRLAPPPVQARPSRPEEVTSSPRKPTDQRASQSSSSTVPMSSPASGVMRSQTTGSDTSAELIAPPHSVVRGFGPNRISSSHRTSSNLTTTHSPVPIKSVLRSRMDAPTNKAPNFMLGGSSEDESSFDDQKSFRTSQSSLTAALKNPQPSSSVQKKMTSFKEEVESRTIAERSAANEDAIDTDDEEEEDGEDQDDDVSESAIEDEEDDSDWEDSATESGAASPSDKPQFPRVDSKPNLVSRRSLLTAQMHQAERAAALAGQASKSQPVIRRSKTASTAQDDDDDDSEDESTATKATGVPRSKPISMAPPSSSAHHALSPRTTRRNMLATELTESLRKNLLWERQQKNTTANAVLRRRHTAHDMANLRQYPENEDGSGSRNNSWNAYFDHGLGEYNARGW